jgi:hypothetical protein
MMGDPKIYEWQVWEELGKDRRVRDRAPRAPTLDELDGDNLDDEPLDDLE